MMDRDYTGLNMLRAYANHHSCYLSNDRLVGVTDDGLVFLFDAKTTGRKGTTIRVAREMTDDEKIDEDLLTDDKSHKPLRFSLLSIHAGPFMQLWM